MTDPNLTPAEPADQPDHYAELAAELHRIADDLAKLVGSGLPKPWVTFGIMPGDEPGDEEVTARVDAVAVALFGHPATTTTDGKGVRRRQAYVRRGPVGCDVHEPLSADDGMSYTRADTDADDPTPISPARRELHTGAMTDGGLVDETPGLAPAPIAAHYDATGWTGAETATAVCACGETFDGFKTLAESDKALTRHVVDAAHADALDAMPASAE